MRGGFSLRRDEPLARHLAARVGGACDAFVVVHRREALADVLDLCAQEGWSVSVLGAGTRAVARDGGVPGAVLRLGSDFARIAPDGDLWQVGAAVPVPALLAAAVQAGMGGLEELARVQGSFGAALALDDGPFAARIEAVTVFARKGEREVELVKARKKGAIVLGARVRLTPRAPGDVAAAVGRALREEPPPGSWYQGVQRGRLRRVLRRAALGDVRLRAVAIPALAPELLVNLGGAQAADLALLLKSAMDRVHRDTGTQLTARVRWLGR